MSEGGQHPEAAAACLVDATPEPASRFRRELGKIVDARSAEVGGPRPPNLRRDIAIACCVGTAILAAIIVVIL